MKNLVLISCLAVLMSFPVMATTSIVPEPTGANVTLDECKDSVTGNIRSCMYLLDPATALPFSPSSAMGTVGSGVPTLTNMMGGKDASGNAQQVSLDPCQIQSHNNTNINISTATTTKIATGVSGKKIAICGLFIYASGIDNVAIVEGTTGSTCATATAGVMGGSTAATGFALNQASPPTGPGFTLGTGARMVASTATNNDDLCLITSGAVQLSGTLIWVTQ